MALCLSSGSGIAIAKSQPESSADADSDAESDSDGQYISDRQGDQMAIAIFLDCLRLALDYGSDTLRCKI